MARDRVVGREREPELRIRKPLPLPALTGRALAGGIWCRIMDRAALADGVGKPSNSAILA